jgi:hypothetical protein
LTIVFVMSRALPIRSWLFLEFQPARIIIKSGLSREIHYQIQLPGKT